MSFPLSLGVSPPVSSGHVEIDVSTTFFPAAILPGANGAHPDLVLYTTDASFFYCHQSILGSRSSNRFGNLIPPPFGTDTTGYTLTVRVGESTDVVNVVLHMIYDMSCSRFAPDLNTIKAAMDALERYGINVPGPKSNIWGLVSRLAVNHPIGAYSLAARHAMEVVCIAISGHTLSVSLDTITEAEALTMGPVYLRLLFFLHLGRFTAIQRIIEAPPERHQPSRGCSEAAQAEVTRAWALAAAHVVVKPMVQNIRSEELRGAFARVLQGWGACPLCLMSIRARVDQVVEAWKQVKVTI